MSRAKKAGLFLTAYLLAFIAVSLIPSFMHRRDFDRTFFAYYKNPTPENAAALRSQERINDYIYIGTNAVGAFFLVCLGYGACIAIRLVAYGLKGISRPGSQQ